jgi:hypothetical protein
LQVVFGRLNVWAKLGLHPLSIDYPSAVVWPVLASVLAVRQVRKHYLAGLSSSARKNRELEIRLEPYHIALP